MLDFFLVVVFVLKFINKDRLPRNVDIFARTSDTGIISIHVWGAFFEALLKIIDIQDEEERPQAWSLEDTTVNCF